MKLNTPFVLASKSPRRKALLEQLGITFTIQPSQIQEVIHNGSSPATIVQSLALQKAEDIARHHQEALVLGADTIVVLDDEILGKPADASEAAAMLQRLQGRTNTVYTGLALVHRPSERSLTAYEATDVTFGPMRPDEIEAYVATGSPLDKAGSYGIQDDYGAQFIAGINGDYYTVVGLPLHRLYYLLRDEFTDLVQAVV